MTTITDPAELAPTCSQCGGALGDIAAECVDCSALLCSADCEDTHACLPQSAPSAPQTDEQAQTRGDSHTKPQTGSQGPLDGCAHAAAADSTGRPPRAPDPALVDGQRVLIEAEVCAGGTRIHTIRPQQFGKIVYLDLAEVVVHRDLPVQAVMDRIDVTAAELRRQIDTIAAALNDGAPGWSQAMAATLARLRSQLAEAREQRDQATEALVRAETERDEARDAQVQHATAMAAIDAEIIDDLRAVLALSPGQSLTKAVTQLRDDLARLRTEAAMLRAEVKQLSARVREWEAVNADIAARCDSGDIPIRLGERYSQAVLREIDRLRAERDRLRRRLGDVLDLEELPEDHTIVAAVRRLRAERSATPDTGSTT